MSALYRDGEGRWREETKHRMGRRRAGWHYAWKGLYMVTLVLADRSRPILGRLVGEGEAVRIELSDLGAEIARLWQTICDFHPEVEPLDFQVMPEHFHGLLRVTREMKKPLGSVIAGFKSGCTKAYWAWIAERNPALPGEARADGGERLAPDPVGAGSLWAPGYVDSIAFDDTRLERQIAYIKDNPRRLALKRANRDLFRVVQRLPFQGGSLSALGNLFLLDAPRFVQVQVSRSATPEAIAEKERASLVAAEEGAVIVSPCLSPGEKQIARAVFAAKARLIVLKNKGFSPFTKPSGVQFDACAEGRLLMLAPAAWPYSPEQKALTRIEACVLNRLAQLICGDDAVEINYRGMTPATIEREVALALEG